MAEYVNICEAAAGDTWDILARQLYGDEKYSYVLLNANPHLMGAKIMDGGEKIIVPSLETDEEIDNIAPWRRGT